MVSFPLQPMLIRNTHVTEQQIDRLRGLIAQPKLDGVRITIQPDANNAGKLLVLTRGNKPVRKDVEEWILMQLSDFYSQRQNNAVFIDCELIYDNDCASSAGVIHSKATKIDYNKLALYIFDAVEFANGADSLWNRLNRNARIINVPSWKHITFAGSYNLAKQFADDHGLVFEGFVLKPATSLYQFGKRLDGSYKFKLQAEMDCIIDSVLPQEDSLGNDKPLAGLFVCHPVLPSPAAPSIRVTASCSNELREIIWQKADSVKGRIITIRYMDVPSGKVTNGLVRMPRYISGLEDLLDKPTIITTNNTTNTNKRK